MIVVADLLASLRDELNKNALAEFADLPGKDLMRIEVPTTMRSSWNPEKNLGTMLPPKSISAFLYYVEEC